MGKINLFLDRPMSEDARFIYFRDCESFSSFFIFMIQRNTPPSALKFSEWEYKLSDQLVSISKQEI